MITSIESGFLSSHFSSHLFTILKALTFDWLEKSVDRKPVPIEVIIIAAEPPAAGVNGGLGAKPQRCGNFFSFFQKIKHILV